MMIPGPGRPIRIMPWLAPVSALLPAQVPGKVCPIQAQPAPAQVLVQLLPPKAQGPMAFAGVGRPGAAGGLRLVDDKDRDIPMARIQTRTRYQGRQITCESTLTYQLTRGQQPTKRVFSGRRSMVLDIPVALTGVPIR